MSIRDILFDYAPEFVTQNSVELARIDRFIEYAKEDVNKTRFGDKYDRAVALKAAHEMTMADTAQLSSSGGEVTSERTRDVAISYKSSSGTEGVYSETKYGRLFLSLLKSIPHRPMLV